MNVPIPTPVPAPTKPTTMLVKPPTMLLLGPAGSGKTWSIWTLLALGLHVYVLGTEQNFLETLLDAIHANVPKDKVDEVMSRLHWHYIQPASPSAAAMDDMAKKIGNMSYADLSNLKMGIAKDDTQQFRSLLETCNNFVDDKTGQAHGSIFALGQNNAFVLDSLSGVNTMAMDLTVGMKPVAAQGEWGVAMNLEEKFLMKLTSDMKCLLVVIAHIERETNEITGGTQIMAAALGRKLAPKLGKMFSEVVLARRGKTAADFKWSTYDTTADLKNRALPISDSIEPSFRVVWEAHQRRLAQIGAPNA